METCDVLVIGAGPAGSTCATLLARGGLSVLLVDRDEFPREKPCAGWITPAVFQSLGIDPQSYRKECLLQDISEFRTGIMNGSEIVTDYGRTVSYAVRRSEFDQFLLVRSGCRTLPGERVAQLEREPDGWLVNGWIRARVLIGAGGHFCPVARALGGRPQGPAIAALQAELELGEEDLASSAPAGTVSLSFTEDLSGYGWFVRKGRYVNVGLGSFNGSEVRRQAAQYCAQLRKRGYLRQDVTERLKGHAYLPYRHQGGRRLSTERALLIGDAAGVSSPESGEGILPAIETAFLAAHTVLAAGGDYRIDTMAPYAASVAERFGKGGGNLMVPQGLKQVAAKVILSNRWLTRHLVLDRWFLHKDQQGLEWGREEPLSWMASEMKE